MLYGPPGTGKTLLVKAAAKESGLPVAFISGADIMSKWQGESEVGSQCCARCTWQLVIALAHAWRWCPPASSEAAVC